MNCDMLAFECTQIHDNYSICKRHFVHISGRLSCKTISINSTRKLRCGQMGFGSLPNSLVSATADRWWDGGGKGVFTKIIQKFTLNW